MKKLIQETISELHNVSWPTKKHAINISKVTIIFTIISAIFIGGSDYILAEAYNVWSSLNPNNTKIIELQEEQSPFEIKVEGTNTGALKIEGAVIQTGTGESL